MSPADSDIPTAGVVLVVGNEEYLVARGVGDVIAAARAAEPGLLLTADLEGAAFGPAEAMALASPDLFGGGRIVVVRGIEDLDEASLGAVRTQATDPAPDLLLVGTHRAGVKARKLPDDLAAAGAVVRRFTAPSRPAERLEFLQDEVRRAGGQTTAGALRALLDAVGNDLRELAAAGRQLVADVDGLIDEAAVARFHRGRAETTGFAVADSAVAGRPAEALALLRSALETGTAPVLLSSALASSLRDIARVRDAGGGAGAIAKSLKMPPWKVEKSLRVARGWDDDGLARAITAVAVADADVKGAAVDASYALERAVLAVVGAHSGGRRRPDHLPR